MDIQFFCPRWGSEQLSWDEFCRKAKIAGYVGIEASLAGSATEQEEMTTALQDHGLLFLGQYYQSFEQDFDTHAAQYEHYLYRLAGLQPRPIMINGQTGKDYFNREQQKLLFEKAAAFTRATGIPVVHETHRNKIFYHAEVSRLLLEDFPDVMLAADFSHWCTVSESYLEDQPAALQLACERARHIHSRVGHPQGAQVTDPRLPEWQTALQHHLVWWKKIASNYRQRGAEVMTITTEFGPAPYMPAVPGTLQPLANQWEINCWMMELLKKELAE